MYYRKFKKQEFSHNYIYYRKKKLKLKYKVNSDKLTTILKIKKKLNFFLNILVLECKAP